MTPKTSKLEEKFIAALEGCGLPEPEREFRFHPTRRWRFDFAWKSEKVAVEIQGGLYSAPVFCHVCKARVMQRTRYGKLFPVFQGTGHTSGKAFDDDVEKYLEAAALGWTVITLSSKYINSDTIGKLKGILNGRITHTSV